MHETFLSLLMNRPHWEFEFVSNGLQDALIFAAAKWWSRREHRFHNVMHKDIVRGKKSKKRSVENAR